MSEYVGHQILSNAFQRTLDRYKNSKQFEKTHDLNVAKFDESVRQFDANLDQRKIEHGDSIGLQTRKIAIAEDMANIQLANYAKTEAKTEVEQNFARELFNSDGYIANQNDFITVGKDVDNNPTYTLNSKGFETLNNLSNVNMIEEYNNYMNDPDSGTTGPGGKKVKLSFTDFSSGVEKSRADATHNAISKLTADLATTTGADSWKELGAEMWWKKHGDTEVIKDDPTTPVNESRTASQIYNAYQASTGGIEPKKEVDVDLMDMAGDGEIYKYKEGHKKEGEMYFDSSGMDVLVGTVPSAHGGDAIKFRTNTAPTVKTGRGDNTVSDELDMIVNAMMKLKNYETSNNFTNQVDELDVRYDPTTKTWKVHEFDPWYKAGSDDYDIEFDGHLPRIKVNKKWINLGGDLTEDDLKNLRDLE